MALLQRKGNLREDEFMLCDVRNQSNRFVAVGEEFDGGTLLYVHQRGGLAVRNDDYLVYPLGATLNMSIPVDSAQDYPELQRAAQYHREAVGYEADEDPGGAQSGRAQDTEVRKAAAPAQPAGKRIDKPSTGQGQEATEQESEKEDQEAERTPRPLKRRPVRSRRPK